MTNQAQFLHKTLDSLVIQRNFTIVQFHGDAAITVSSFVLMVNCSYFCLCIFILIMTIHSLEMIVESCTGQLSD